MGWYLIGVTSILADVGFWAAIILQVAIALGLVIFVHELGHFLVAKLCRVKCEKFYLGFDIYGWRLCRFRWGETEYGIGILPLGGYVKMLGQEDNPARLREEIARAKRQQVQPNGATGSLPASAQNAENAPADRPSSSDSSAAASGEATTAAAAEPEKSVDLAAAERALFDPRSYLAKSVPKRMAIISAGVIMNVIFAFVCATIAYRLGVKQITSTVGGLVPGGPAWQAGLRVGDRIEEIAGRKTPRFRDVKVKVSLGDNLAEGIPVVVCRPGVEEPLTFKVFPVRGDLAPVIGVANAGTTTLSKNERPARPGSAAAKAEPPLESGEKIVALDDQHVHSYAEIVAYLAQHPEQPLQVSVRRPLPDQHRQAEAAESSGSAPGKDAESPAFIRRVTVPPTKIRCLKGLEMVMGKISAIQAGSPAADPKVDLRKGDLITTFDGKPVGDPMSWPDRLRRRAGRTITLGIQREGEPILKQVTLLGQLHCYEEPFSPGTPMSVPHLGIAYHVLNEVAKVDDGSPAAAAGLRPGDEIVQATILRPSKEIVDRYQLDDEQVTLDFTEKEQNWPFFMHVLQKRTVAGSQVKLARKNGDPVTLDVEEADDWLNPDRGFLFEPEEFTEVAADWWEAVELGARETGESLAMVVLFLRKVGTQVSIRSIGGPGTIAVIAAGAAREGIPALLIFLAVLSANLAVLNFLPIPVLDGGHMVFLAWEGIRRKPPDERVQLALTYVGLAMILALMVLAIGLDVDRLLHWLGLKG